MGLTRRQKRNKVVREARRIIATASEGGEFDACDSPMAAEAHAQELLAPANYQVSVHARLTKHEMHRPAGVPRTEARFAFVIGPLEGPAPGSHDREAKEAKALRMEWSTAQREKARTGPRYFSLGARQYAKGLSAENFRQSWARLGRQMHQNIAVDYAKLEAETLLATYKKMFPEVGTYLKEVQKNLAPGNHTFQIESVRMLHDEILVDLKEVKSE